MNVPTTMRPLRLVLWPLGALWVAYVVGVVAEAGNPWYYVAGVAGVAAAFMRSVS